VCGRGACEGGRDPGPTVEEKLVLVVREAVEADRVRVDDA
jgi:hypothetical protein